MQVIPFHAPAAQAPPSTRRCDRTAEFAPRPRTPCADAPSVISPDDWAILFDAVVVQLRRTVAVRTDAGPDAKAQVHGAGRVRDRVLECAAALEKLRAGRAPGDARRVALHLAAKRP